MPKVKGIFVSPQGELAHAAVGFHDCLVEACQTEVCQSPLCKYRDAQVLIVVEVPVDFEQYTAGLMLVDQLRRGRSLQPLNPATVYTAVFRAMFPGFLAGHALSEITLQTAYEATVELLSGGT